MTENTEKPHRRFRIGGAKFVVAILLILVYSASAAYGVMSDMSVRGLTVKMFNISRNCTNPSTYLKTLSYNLRGSIWSTSSIQTRLSQQSFSLSVDGSVIGTTTQSDTSFGPGQSASFNLTFTDPALNPTVLPLTSRIVLALSATVAAGLYSAPVTASDSTLHTFNISGC